MSVNGKNAALMGWQMVLHAVRKSGETSGARGPVKRSRGGCANGEEIPKARFQIPNKSQATSSKLQGARSQMCAVKFEIWILEFPWNLESGAWNFHRAADC
jgi:hypothetical protein